MANLNPIGYDWQDLCRVQALGLVVSDKEIILRFPIVSLWEMMTPGLGQFRPQGHDWEDLCWVPLIIATHKILKLLTSCFQRRRFFNVFLL